MNMKIFGSKETPVAQLVEAKAALEALTAEKVELTKQLNAALEITRSQAEEITKLKEEIQAKQAEAQAAIEAKETELKEVTQSEEAKVTAQVIEIASAMGVPPVQAQPEAEQTSAKSVWDEYHNLPKSEQFAFWQKNKNRLMKA